MIFVKIFSSLFIVINAKVIEILLTEGDYHKSLSGLGAFPLHNNFLKFKVKGCKDCHVILKSIHLTEAPYYYIFIGGWGNGKSRLDKHITKGHSVILDEMDFEALDCTYYKDFWISWDKGKMLVGRGDTLNKDVFLSYNESCPFKIQDIQASAMVPNTWLIDTAQFVQEPVVTSKRKRVVQVKPTTCPTFRVLGTMTGVSLVECVSLCLLKAECGSIQYDDVTKACKHESTIVDTTAESLHHKIIFQQ